jgi:uncharacterized membrane protein
MCCKFLTVALSLIISIFALVVCILFLAKGGDPDSWFAASEEQCHTFVKIFYLGYVVFGLIVLNLVVRVPLINAISMRLASNYIKKQKISGSKKTKQGY